MLEKLIIEKAEKVNFRNISRSNILTEICNLGKKEEDNE